MLLKGQLSKSTQVLRKAVFSTDSDGKTSAADKKKEKIKKKEEEKTNRTGFTRLLTNFIHRRTDFICPAEEASPPEDEASTPANKASQVGPYIFTKLAKVFFLLFIPPCLFMSKKVD